MKVQSVTNYGYPANLQSFESNKFRLPVELVTKPEGCTWSSVMKLPGKWVREYDNPEAGTIYKKAQQAKSLEEKLDLYKQMGHYELKKQSLKERLIGLYDRICSNLFLK